MVGVVAIVLAYLTGLNLAWQPVQLRVWNRSDGCWFATGSPGM